MDETEKETLNIRIIIAVPFPKFPMVFLRDNFLQLIVSELRLQEKAGLTLLSHTRIARILNRSIGFYSPDGRKKANSLKTIQVKLSDYFRDRKERLGRKKD